MGYHLKREEFWGIKTPSSGFMTKLFITRKEARDFLKFERYPDTYKEKRVKITEVSRP